MNDGWVKLFRSITAWEWWGDKNTTIMFIYLVVTANSKDTRWRGIDIPRGSLVTSRKQLAEGAKMTEKEARTALEHLQSTGEVAIKATKKYSIVSVCKYEDYQATPTYERPTERPSSGQVAAKCGPTEREKEKEKEKKIPPTPPIIENKNKNKKREQEGKNNITFTYVNVPKTDVSAANEQIFNLQHRCRLFFENIYEQKKGDKYYYAAKDAAALKQLLNKIKFLMPEEQKKDEAKLEENFQIFINTIFHSKILGAWITDNLSLPIINDKFNEIYSQLKNGKSSSNAADNFHVFGSRNITPDILAEFA